MQCLCSNGKVSNLDETECITTCRTGEILNADNKCICDHSHTLNLKGKNCIATCENGAIKDADTN